jgi:uncharacterized membrane protein
MIPEKKNDAWKDNHPDKETWEKWKKDPNKWKWGGIYYNQDDKRLFVPKKIEWMGITINFANKKAKWVSILFLLFFSIVLFFIQKKN